MHQASWGMNSLTDFVQPVYITGTNTSGDSKENLAISHHTTIGTNSTTQLA